MSHVAELTDVAADADRRVKRWIDPTFQRQYAILLLSVVFLVGATLIGTFWYHSEQVMKVMLGSGFTANHSFFQLVGHQMRDLMISVVVVTLCFGAFVFVCAIHISHRIVGPIFSIKRSLECLVRGNTEAARLKLRSDDEFQDVSALVNALADEMDKARR